MDAMAALDNSSTAVRTMYEQLRAEGKIPQDIALLNVGADSATVSNFFDAIDGPATSRWTIALIKWWSSVKRGLWHS